VRFLRLAWRAGAGQRERSDEQENQGCDTNPSVNHRPASVPEIHAERVAKRALMLSPTRAYLLRVLLSLFWRLGRPPGEEARYFSLVAAVALPELAHQVTFFEVEPD